MFCGKYMQRIACFTLIVFMGMILTAEGSFAKAGTAQAEFSSPQVKEKAGIAPVMGKKKNFPIVWVAMGAAVAVGLILILGKKKDDPQHPEPAAATYIDGILTVKGVRYEMTAIPAGTFAMGSASTEALPDQKPVHAITISRGFWLGKTEVTQGLWKAAMGSNPANFQSGDNYPVEQVSWDDCQRFIAKLNQLTGKNSFRLPTEAEWEYACRAGTTSERYGDLNAVAWYSANSGNLTHSVAQKLPNDWGLYDTLGNVDEWCADWWSETFYSQSPAVDPQGPPSGAKRVLRGGDSFFEAEWSRAAFRIDAEPSHANKATGLRLAAASAGN
jgi:formylglycine-generating enzyme required for sulfatase activity